MQLVIKILNKVKEEHEAYLSSTEDLLEASNAKHYPKWMQEKRGKSQELLKEVNKSIAVLSAYEITKNQIENLNN